MQLSCMKHIQLTTTDAESAPMRQHAAGLGKDFCSLDRGCESFVLSQKTPYFYQSLFLITQCPWWTSLID